MRCRNSKRCLSLELCLWGVEKVDVSILVDHQV